MCGRFSLKTPIPELSELFRADASTLGPQDPRFNVAPTEDIVIVRTNQGSRELASLRWGLIPSWAEELTDLPLMINARSESLESRRAFRDLVPNRRCAILADGFFEWRSEYGIRQPYFVRRCDQLPIAFAGLWDEWRGPVSTIESCTIVTTSANDLLRPLHNRMPVILDDAGTQLWLDQGMNVRTCFPLDTCEYEGLEAFPVSTRVNRVSHVVPDCIEPIDLPVRAPHDWRSRPSEEQASPGQLGLF